MPSPRLPFHSRALPLLLGLLLFSSSAFAIQSGATVDRRGLLGVLLDGQYAGDESQGTPEGVRLSQIQPGLAADRANLQEGDVVLAVNGKAVRTVRALQIDISSKKPGTEVTLTVYRDGQVFQRQVVLGDWFDFLVRTPIFGPFLNDVTLRRLEPSIRERLDLPVDMDGAVITQIADRSLYQFVLQPGAVITEINGKPITEIRDMEDLPEGDTLNVSFYDQGVFGSFALISALN